MTLSSAVYAGIACVALALVIYGMFKLVIVYTIESIAVLLVIYLVILFYLGFGGPT